MTSLIETTSEFTKTAGVFESSVAKRYIWRLRAARIPHFVQPSDGDCLRISVHPRDLKNAVALQPPHIDAISNATKTSTIHARVLIGIALGVLSGAAIGNFFGGGHAYFALPCVLVCVAILETNARNVSSVTKS